MTEIAPGLWQLACFPPNGVNVYLVGDVLIDAGTWWMEGGVLRQLRGRRLSMIALTHCHPDHQGLAAVLCRRFGVPLACPEGDADVMEGRARVRPYNPLTRIGARLIGGPPYPVARRLRDGDTVAGFRVVATPGHTPGHVSYFRESDRVLIAGDVLANLNVLTGGPRLGEPPFFFSDDRARNRESIRLLAELRPAVVCFGHGPPLRDPAKLDALAFGSPPR